jgi:hypothetical protein
MSPWNPLRGRSCKASPGKLYQPRTSMGEHLRTLRGKLDRIHIKLVERDQENQSVRLALRTLRGLTGFSGMTSEGQSRIGKTVAVRETLPPIVLWRGSLKSQARYRLSCSR